MKNIYFIRTKDFYELISYKENNIYFIKEIKGHFSRIGKKEQKFFENVIKFDSVKKQKEYFYNKIDLLLENGYIRFERQYLVSGIVKYEYEFENAPYYFRCYDNESTSLILNELNHIENKNHICIEFWTKDFKGRYGIKDILDYFIKNKYKYINTEYFTFGNVSDEFCEISWINQSDYTDFLKTFYNIKGLFIQGTEGLKLGKMNLPNLEILEIQGSSLNNNILSDIIESRLPNLKRLNLFFGVEEYGLDIDINYIENLLNNTNFEKLEVLGLCNINKDLFSIVLERVFNSNYSKQIKVLDMSMSVSTDEDLKYILYNIYKLKNIKFLDLNYNYFSEKMCEIAKDTLNNIEIDLSVNNKFEEYINFIPMYTE